MPGSLVSGRRCTSVVRVRKDGVTALMDGAVVLEDKTDYRDRGMESEWALRDRAALGVAVQEGRVRFHRIAVREIGGKGELVRSASR